VVDHIPSPPIAPPDLEPGWQQAVVIRYTRESDLPALEWDGEYSHMRRIYAETYQRTQQGQALMWLAEHPAAGVIGQVFAQVRTQQKKMPRREKQAYIHSVRVKPDYRNAGIGTRLMHTAEGDLARRGFSQVSLNVAFANPNARRLYERLGYRPVEQVAGQWSYYDHNNVLRRVNEPGWRMMKKL